jgi:hypothetical protein
MLKSAIETADANGFCLNIRFSWDYLFGERQALPAASQVLMIGK